MMIEALAHDQEKASRAMFDDYAEANFLSSQSFQKSSIKNAAHCFAEEVLNDGN